MTDKARAIFVRDARLAFSYPLSFGMQWFGIGIAVTTIWFISKLVPPSSHFSFNGGAASYFDFAIVNVAFLAFQTAALASFERSIRDDQIFGTLETTFATPTSVHLIVLASALWAFTITTVNVVIYLGFGMLFGMHLAGLNPAACAVMLALTITATIPLGILTAAGTMVFKQAAPVQTMLNMASSLFAGVMFPVAVLPASLQVVSWFLPATHALHGIRGALQGADLRQIAPDVWWLGVLSAVSLPAALWIFDAAVKRAKFDGTLAQY